MEKSLLSDQSGNHNQPAEFLAQQYQILADCSFDWETWIAPQGNYLYCSPSCERITGYSPDEFLNNSAFLLTLVHPHDREAVEKHFCNEADFQAAPALDFRIQTKNGEERWIEHLCQPILNPNGIYLGQRGSNRDITKRKQAEITALKQERLLENAEAIAHLGSYELDLETNSVHWSRETFRILGLDENSQATSVETYASFIHPQDVQAVYDLFGLCLQTGQDFALEYRIVRPSGEIRHVRSLGNTVKNDAGKITGMIGTYQDITEKKLVDDNLRENEARYQRLTNNAPDIIFRYEILPTMRLAYVNPSIHALMGYTPEECYADPYLMLNLLHPEDSEFMAERIQTLAPSDGPYVLRWIGKDKVTRWMESRLVTLRDMSGQLVAIEGITRDITERKAAEQFSKQNENRLQQLHEIFHYDAKDSQDLLDFAIGAALRLTNSKIGYIYHYRESTQKFTLNTWSNEVMRECGILQPERMYELSKTGIWGEVVRQRQPIIENHFADANPLKKGYPEGHVALTRFLSIPVIIEGEIVAVVGVANKETDYTHTDILQLSLLMDSVWKILERKQAEDSLRLQAHALNAAANAIVITNLNGDIDWVNPAFSALTGYTSSEVVGKNPRDLVKSGKHDRAFYHQMWDTILNGNVWQGEVINRRKNGTLYTEELTITPVRSQEGPIAQFIAIKQDISDRKRVEIALNQSNIELSQALSEKEHLLNDLGESELRFRQLAENMREVFWLRDRKTENVLYVSPAFETVWGVSCNDLYQDPAHFSKSIHPDDFERVKNAKTAMQLSGQDFNENYRILRPDGTFRWIATRIYPVSDPFGVVVRFAGIAEDITERVQSEGAHRQLEEKFTKAFHTSPDAININRLRDGLYIDINEGFTALTGYSAEEAVGKTSHEIHLWENPQDRERLVQGLKEHGEVWNLEAPFRIKNGTIKICLMSAKIIETNGETCILSITRDITERKQAEVLLRETTQDLQLAYDATLQGWSNALELRERETAGHSQRVVNLTINMAQAFGVSPEDMVHFQRGALLHDIGKMGVPDNILLKPGPLSDDEWVIMRQHPIYAYRLLSKIPYLTQALDIPYAHHERWDGTGYPRGLSGENIPLAARIFSIIDVWDALLSDRPYRPAWTKNAVYQYLLAQSGKQFDPHVVEVFLTLMSNYEQPSD